MRIVRDDWIPSDFIHEPPEGYSYEVQQYKRNILSIWLLYHCQYNYNDGDPISTIWGFVKYKTTKAVRTLMPPSTQIRSEKVDMQNTRPYTAMQLNLTPLEKLLL